ncbi:tRNA (guanosine(37)-N1)-methyltransferase TrmD [Thermotoga sp. SG1]|uniref:tRNA (guanosine(37)-N1)-methyltransferase TrmD n=1 Tax=Thermotoga sp. SG1 TaxID=126739 RepID=UPI000C758DFD|nr:tRNA (guanosine(37)-N1)-methyltransferase TrmD [Thermotoga sp. SG1]PLV55798.1 tRNA (guanine-N1)-methyltransferase [Thermotoga sp. SG1]
MRITIVTIFPEMVEVVKKYGVIARAVERGIVEINVENLRDYTTDRHRTVDDYQYGGGYGMVMKPEPFFRFYENYVEKHGKPYVILTSPQGRIFNYKIAEELSKKDDIVIFCGRYEGIDERVMSIVDDEISIGDYILTGGELPAMVITDAIVRLVPGVVERESVERESFHQGFLDHPVYTRPYEYRGMKVPEVLLSGDHQKVELWRRKESIKKTIMKRPDLFLSKELDELDKLAIIELFRELMEKC